MDLELVIAVLVTIGFLVGIRLMQSPETALWGNRLGAASMAVAIVFAFHLTGTGLSAVAYLAVGALAGIVIGQKVRMIQMPQTVALFNGLGGGASALVAATAMAIEGTGATAVVLSTAALALGIGVLTFSGSVVAALKLQAWISQRPIVLKGHGVILALLLLAGIAAIALLIAAPVGGLRVAIVVLFAAYGVLMALRIGGADMPVVISLLNSFSGVAAAVSGMAVGNPLLTGVGALVGVAGMILTQVMCRAMNRSLAAVLSGFTVKATPERSAAAGGAAAARGAAAYDGATPAGGAADSVRSADSAGRERTRVTENDLIPLLQQARKIVFVPGYGMALAQAQQSVRTLANALERDGKEVSFGIHPVAGRMPGHMNVLLAEAGIKFRKMRDMRLINPEFAETDVVIVVGACDVINPAAATAEGTPIYGMPVLHAAEAKAVVVCNLDEKPGYSGVDNSLYHQEHVITLWDDAKESVSRITRDYRNARAAMTASRPASERPAAAQIESAREFASVLREAKRIIVVPGYGVALAQAQEALKTLMDILESHGKELTIALHPLAGRILGHLPFLLVDIGVELEKFDFLSNVNPRFAHADAALVVGACDITNPAAMDPGDGQPAPTPALRVADAKRVLVCNFDDRPGPSGLPNPLYAGSNVTVFWGDAARALPLITEHYLEASSTTNA